MSLKKDKDVVTKGKAGSYQYFLLDNLPVTLYKVVLPE